MRARLQKQYSLAVSDFEKLDEFDGDSEETTISKTNQAPCTFDGKKYLPAVRTLYYSLLASQIPPGKIRNIIKDVVKAFIPDIDVESLKLPGSTCANYMRREELKIVCMAHQVDLLSEADTLYLNSDGTTKDQHKLNAIAFNGVVLSISEVPDGTADSIIGDIDRQLQKLRCFAEELGIPNNKMLNWSMICASTSDSASTQKRLNDLIQQRKDDDMKAFPVAGNESIDIVRSFCSMHLGINLRKAAFVTAQIEWQEAIDSFVYECCKLFSGHGSPEYGVHIQFQDFLCYRASQMDDNQVYYQTCCNISLSRQIGSRYFVTSHNATKILFLSNAAIEFLEFTNKSNDGNKLEKDVFCKLMDSCVIDLLKVDALMYHHVYADLILLAKSRELKKSVYSMREHYLELKVFLEKLEESPKTISNRHYEVFPSECRLYHDAKFNHRTHKHTCCASECFQEHLFQSLSDDDSFYSKVAAGASCMKEKLSAYAKDFLPDGLYWNVDEKTADVLKKLEPSNDLSESILGLNDYLCTALPNLVQLTKSNLVELKKNHTMKWFNDLPEERREIIIEIAMKKRKDVREDFKNTQKFISERRQSRMLQKKKKIDTLRKKQAVEKEQLSKLHLITSVTEFETVIGNIEGEDLPKTKQDSKALNLLKEQVRIRKKLLMQKTKITFTSNGRKRPLSVLIEEVQRLIRDSPVSGCYSSTTDCDPYALVGKTIMHKFIVNDVEEQWFSGFVSDYDGETHHIEYEDSNEIFHFNLIEDLLQWHIFLSFSDLLFLSQFFLYCIT